MLRSRSCGIWRSVVWNQGFVGTWCLHFRGGVWRQQVSTKHRHLPTKLNGLSSQIIFISAAKYFVNKRGLLYCNVLTLRHCSGKMATNVFNRPTSWHCSVQIQPAEGRAVSVKLASRWNPGNTCDFREPSLPASHSDFKVFGMKTVINIILRGGLKRNVAIFISARDWFLIIGCWEAVCSYALVFVVFALAFKWGWNQLSG
jgi:hypothetical protein